jgi:hypothetical protein
MTNGGGGFNMPLTIQNISGEELLKTLSHEKVAQKTLVKLTPQ